MNWTWVGRAWVFGDDVPNDEGIMPLRLVRQQEYEPAELAKYCFEQVNAQFAWLAKAQDIVVGGKNFGYGNPHIQGFLGLKGVGVGVLAESMSRGPMRACINAGVPVLAIPGVTKLARDGDTLVVDWLTGLVVNETTGARLQATPLAQVMREIVESGGGIGYMKKRLAMTTELEKTT
jgi:3-isopropylmalate/(R)-2-methylmalate dehydratase small subunit